MGQTLTDAGATRDGAPARPLPERLAHFRLERSLGAGGMGEVYRAIDEGLDRPVAIKVLGGAVAGDPERRERFLREARAQARIQHPNVCHIYYVGEQDGHLFFAMELIDGESLADRLARDGQVPLGEALELCRQAALGLREAARAGFTHRDVKPSNLMVDRHGAVKVVDFGIAAPTVDLTGDGEAAGTPLYMAPEQARGEAVDLRADIYALGATLHHLIAGQPPFAGETATVLLSRHRADPRPRLPARRRQAAPVDALLDRMMAKDPADRFGSYDDLIAAFDQVSPARARPAGFWVRAAALALDAIFVQLATVPFDTVVGEPDQDVVFPIVATIYVLAATARWGRTLGKAAFEIEVAPAHASGRVGLRRAGLRWLAQWGATVSAAATLGVYQLATGSSDNPPAWLLIPALAVMVLPLLAGAAWTALSPTRTAPWDRAAGTRVRYRTPRNHR